MTAVSRGLDTRAVVAGATGALDREILRHLDSGTTNSNAPGAGTSSADRSSSSPDARHSSSQATQGGTGCSTSPVLELVLEGKPVAVAVKKRGKRLHSQNHPPGRHAAHDSRQSNFDWQHSSSQTGGTAPARSPGKGSETWTCIYSMDGTVLATEQDGNLHKDGVTGPHSHTVLTGQTPLVRHLHVVSIAAGMCAAKLYIVGFLLVELHFPCFKLECRTLTVGLVEIIVWTLLQLALPLYTMLVATRRLCCIGRHSNDSKWLLYVLPCNACIILRSASLQCTPLQGVRGADLLIV